MSSWAEIVAQRSSHRESPVSQEALNQDSQSSDQSGINQDQRNSGGDAIYRRNGGRGYRGNHTGGRHSNRGSRSRNSEGMGAEFSRRTYRGDRDHRNVAELNRRAIGLLQNAASITEDSLKYNIIIVLIGLPGSGKSTFSNAILTNTNRDRWAVCNQDILGDRGSVYIAAKRHLKLIDSYGASIEYIPESMPPWKGVVIDRCNFNKSQRQHWQQLADESYVTLRPVLSLCVVMPRAGDASYCTQRAITRGADGVHSGHENWNAIIRRMASEYHLPDSDEGFSAIYSLNSSNSGSGSIQELIELISALE